MLGITLTLTFAPWMVPVGITLLAALIVAAVCYSERNDTGLLSGLGGLIAMVAAAAAIAATWLAYFGVRLLS